MADLEEGLSKLPEHMQRPLRLWIEQGFPHPRMMGAFLKALLQNNLVGTYHTADDTNLKNIPAFVNFLYNYAPTESWGSSESLEKWWQYHQDIKEKDDSNEQVDG
jgi:hypothetical protein